MPSVGIIVAHVRVTQQYRYKGVVYDGVCLESSVFSDGRLVVQMQVVDDTELLPPSEVEARPPEPAFNKVCHITLTTASS